MAYAYILPQYSFNSMNKSGSSVSTLYDLSNKGNTIGLVWGKIHVFMPPERMIGGNCFCPVCLSVCLSVCCQL